MPAHLIFLTIFLGIVSGKQGVELQAGPAIKSIRILLANREIARLTQPPWKSEIDLGPELVPRELTAIGYDANGSEIARTSQTLNLPRPYAEVQIVRDAGGAQLRWSNLEHKAPRSARVTFDGAPLKIDDNYRVHFPDIADARPHVVSAEMRFDDGVVARREAIVEGSEFSDAAETQLTPVVVNEISPKHPATYDGCFTIDGGPARVAAVDRDNALVIFVQDPQPYDTIHALDPARRAYSMFTRAQMARLAQLEPDTRQEVLWPIVQQFRAGSAMTMLFEHTAEMTPQGGLMALLTRENPLDGPRRFADAVAVAGVHALEGARRRAVVAVLDDRADVSGNDPREVRRYLEALGVPLFVWSPVEPSREVVQRWGTVEDISTIDHLRYATFKLREALARQRVAWIAAPPLDALRVKADERCGFAR